jgi:hypothetical protein
LYRDPDEYLESITFENDDHQTTENKIISQMESYLSNKQPKFILSMPQIKALYNRRYQQMN